ncbi:hypothetical protein BH09ACT5_BH09ACT5_10700 [soil metagenome]
MSALGSFVAPHVRRAVSSGTALESATRALLWIMVAADGLFFLGLLLSGGPLVNVWLSLATQWIPVTIFWLVAARTRFRQAPVILAAAGVTASALGDTYYSLAMDGTGYLAFPSPADAGYLLFYPLMVAAVIMVVRRQLGTAGPLVLLETAVATVGASAVIAVVMNPVITRALDGGTLTETAIAVAYPLFDLLLLAVVAGIASVPTIEVGRRWWSLVVGLSVFAVADIVYALLDPGSYLAGTILDAAWAIGLAFITWWAAATPTLGCAAEPRTRRAFIVPVPAAAVLAGLAVLVIGTQTSLSLLAVILAALTVGLATAPVIFRQALLGRVLAAQNEAVRQLTELHQDKSDLMVTMNHEFRTPLTSINGNVELLLDGDAGELPPAAVGMLRTIEGNGARLQDLIDDMLTVSRLEAGQARLTMSPLYVSGLVNRASAAIAASARARGIELITSCDNFALVVDADGPQLERALVSIIDNAVKFTAPGGRVTITAEGPTPDGEIVVVVSDTGMGIPRADIPKVFDRFFRASNVQRAAIPGAGLGLSIAHRVVQAHGGRIDVESVMGQGTTISVRLAASATGVRMPRPAPAQGLLFPETADALEG